MGHFPFNKNAGLKFWKFHVPNGTVHSGYTDSTQATVRFSNGYCSCKQDGAGDNDFVTGFAQS